MPTALSGSEPSSLLSRVARRLAVPGRGSPAVEKLRRKFANNLALSWPELFSKSVRFATSTVRTRCQLRDVERVGVGVRIEGVAPAIDNRGGRILLGDDVVLSAPRTPIHMALRPDAVLRIGERTWVNDGVWFGCTGRITIGERVLIGPGVRVFDNDYHDFYQRWSAPTPRPVTIEDDVWIASDAIVLRGVTIGRGAVVGAASVVLEDVEPFTVVVGNPARVVKRLDPQRFEPFRAG